MPLLETPNVQQLTADGNIKGLIKALGYHQAASVRMEAAKSLGRMGANEAIGPLATALDDDDQQVRLSAVTALGKIGKLAIQPLISALKNKDEELRQHAAKALELNGIPVTNLLLSMLKDDAPYARIKLVVATGKEAQRGPEEEGMHYSQKGQQSRDIFFQLPLSRRTCPECKIARGEDNPWKVVGEVTFLGALKLECPICSHIGVFIPQ